MQQPGKESSQEGKEQDQQAVGDHQPRPLMYSHSVEGASLPGSLCYLLRGVLTPFPPLRLPSDEILKGHEGAGSFNSPFGKPEWLQKCRECLPVSLMEQGQCPSTQPRDALAPDFQRPSGSLAKSQMKPTAFV